MYKTRTVTVTSDANMDAALADLPPGSLRSITYIGSGLNHAQRYLIVFELPNEEGANWKDNYKPEEQAPRYQFTDY